jgi:hypothetical protein
MPGEKLAEYYAKFDDAPVYYTAMIAALAVYYYPFGALVA